MKRISCCLLLAAMLCLLLSFPVFAAQTGSLLLKNISAPVTLFPVADARGALNASFSGALAEPLNQTNANAATAKAFQKYAKEKALSGQEKTPDEFKQVFYDQLQEGYYLVCSQAEPGEFAPFLLQIPMTVGDKTIYNVQAEPKAQQPGDPDGPSAPPPLQPVIPQTGHIQWPKYLLLILGAVCIAAGLFEGFRGREKRHE